MGTKPSREAIEAVSVILDGASDFDKQVPSALRAAYAIDFAALRAELQAARERIAELEREAIEFAKHFNLQSASWISIGQELELKSKRLEQQLQAAREDIQRLNGRVADLWLGKFPTDPVAFLSSQLATAQAESEWRTIETAPKDGTWILLMGESGYINRPYRVHVGNWGERDWWMQSEDCSFEDDGGPPTHWMPLPDPPKEEGDGR